MKIFTKKLQKVVCFGLSLGVMAGLMAVPGYRVHADETSEISNENEVVYTEDETNEEVIVENETVSVSESGTGVEAVEELSEEVLSVLSNEAVIAKKENLKTMCFIKKECEKRKIDLKIFYNDFDKSILENGKKLKEIIYER